MRLGKAEGRDTPRITIVRKRRPIHLMDSAPAVKGLAEAEILLPRRSTAPLPEKQHPALNQTERHRKAKELEAHTVRNQNNQ